MPESGWRTWRSEVLQRKRDGQHADRNGLMRFSQTAESIITEESVGFITVLTDLRETENILAHLYFIFWGLFHRVRDTSFTVFVLPSGFII